MALEIIITCIFQAAQNLLHADFQPDDIPGQFERAFPPSSHQVWQASTWRGWSPKATYNKALVILQEERHPASDESLGPLSSDPACIIVCAAHLLTDHRGAQGRSRREKAYPSRRRRATPPSPPWRAGPARMEPPVPPPPPPTPFRARTNNFSVGIVAFLLLASLHGVGLRGWVTLGF